MNIQNINVNNINVNPPEDTNTVRFLCPLHTIANLVIGLKVFVYRVLFTIYFFEKETALILSFSLNHKLFVGRTCS